MVITQKAARINAGLTQGDVAEMLGVRRATICKWEKGKVKMKDYQKSRLADIYNIDIKCIKFADEEE